MTDIVERLDGPIMQAAKDLIDNYFGNSAKVLASIPADLQRDADLVLMQGLRDARDTIIALRDELAEASKTVDLWQKMSRETFEAMCAMRNAINEHIPMPSLESDLLQGPENSVFCAEVAGAVVGAILALRSQRAEVLLEVRDAIADYPRTSPDGLEAQHYDEQIEHCQAIIDALIDAPKEQG